MASHDLGSWHILRDRKTDGYVVFNPETDTKNRKSGESSRYENIGIMRAKNDADAYIMFREIGLAPDALAYLCREHQVREAVKNGSPVATEELFQRAKSVHEETGRSCFGTCDSINGAAACAVCFGSNRDTWNLCAFVKCVLAEAGTDIKSENQKAKAQVAAER